MSFISEIRRRNVFKVAIAYAAVSWLLIQIVISIEAPLGLPDWFDTVVILFVAIGFPVALVLAWAFELTPEGIKPTESVGRDVSITRQTGQKLNRITIGVLTIAVILLLADRFFFDASTDVIPNSIAVLPFENLSPDRGDAYFAPGLHEEILNQLQKIRNLTVIARTTMSQYEHTDKSIAEIAKELSVEAVMEGSVRYADNRVRVTAQLIDPVTDGHLWSDTYERDFEDIFAIESDLAMNVANAMVVEFSLEEQEKIEQIPTVSADAYALLLSTAALVGQGTPAAVSMALDQIDRATELDPRSARLWAQKAALQAYSTIFFPARTDEFLTEAVDAANRALEIDPSTEDAYAPLAMVAAARGQWLVAEDHFRMAAPSAGSGGLEPFAAFHFIVGDTRQAFEAITAVRERDPLNSNAWFWAVVAYDAMGDVAASLEAYERGTRLFAGWPAGHNNAFLTLLGDGQIEPAMDLARNHLSGPVIELALNGIDSPDAAIVELNRLYLEEPAVDPARIAALAAYLGDIDLATRALGDNMEKSPINGHIIWRPLFRDVRQAESFKTLLRDYGFVAYWQKYGWPDHCDPLDGDDFVCS